MAKQRKKHSKKRPHIPMAVVMPALLDGQMVYNAAKDGLTQTEINNLNYYFTGWNGTNVDMGRLVNTYGKYGAGMLISYGATKLGINKRIYKLTKGYVGI
jgi:hypothetical protein